MVSRHRQTSFPQEQPVRFYKIVALTFLILTIILLGVIVFMSSKRAEIIITTKPTPVDVNTDVTIGAVKNGDDIEGMVTTTVVSMEKTFQVTGNREEPAVAEGTVTLHNETGAAQPLVATTRLLSEGGILFRLKDRVTVPARGTVTAAVYADEAGKQGEIGPSKFTIPGLAESKQTVIYATSDAAMTGGIRIVGSLGSDDFESAKRSFADALQKEGEQSLALLFPDKRAVFATESVTVSSTADVGAEVGSFTLRGSGVVVGVFYDLDAMKNLAKNYLSKRAIDDSESIETSKNDPTITLSEYHKDTRTATVHLFYDGVATLNPQSKQIERSMFFGKSKEEVRRYLLSLDHVHSVDVKFHPAWMQSVPHIHDHVQVIVKEVE